MTELFADFLKHQIACRGWSGQKLADNLDIDGGLVRAWIRGDRIPTERHECIARLSEILEIPEGQIEECQRASLDLRKKQKREKKIDGSSRDLRLLTSLPSDRTYTQKYTDYQIPPTIEGAKEVVQAVISILERLQDLDSNNLDSQRKEILLTFQGRQSSLNQDEELGDRWIDAVRVLLEKGWQVHQLIRLDDDWVRIIKWAKFVLNVIDKRDGYKPFYSRQKYVLEPHNGYLIVPEREALEFYAAKQSLFTDAAFYFPEVDRVRVLESHFARLQEEAVPLFDRYPNYQHPEFIKTIAEADREFGQRTIFLKRFCEITRPPSWYEPNSNWARSLRLFFNYSERELREHLKFRRKRALSLEEHLSKGRYEYRYIYPKSCFQEFIDRGTTNKYLAYCFQATPQERLEQLENLVRLLVSYPNYQIALLEGEDDLTFDNIKPSFCEVQGYHVFFMEVRVMNELEILESEWFVTKEPTVAEAFQKYFNELWKGIPHDRKNRYILQWLQGQIDNLKAEIK